MEGRALLRRATLPLAIALLLLGPAAPLPASARAATSPCLGSTATITLRYLLWLQELEPWPAADQTAPMLVSNAGLECHAGRTLRFVAYVRDPGIVGWEYTYGLRPRWFQGLGLFVAATPDPDPASEPLTALAIPPALGDLQARYVGRRVMVTGHFDDPAAATCTAAGEPGVAPSAVKAVAICRATFVVTAVTTATGPATSTGPAPEAPGESSRPATWLGLTALFGGLAAGWLVLRKGRLR